MHYKRMKLGNWSIYLVVRNQWAVSKEQKIGSFGRFFDEKSVFGWHGNDFDKKKIRRKKIGKKSGKIADFSAKNRKYPIFSRKNPIFPEILSKLYLGHSRERN